MKSQLLLFALVAATACDDDSFDARWSVTEPRLLGVRAEPPLITPNGEVQLEALAVTATGEAASSPVTWRACNPWQFVLDPDLDCGPDNSLPIDGVLRAADLLAAFPPPSGTMLPTGALPEVDPCQELPGLSLPVVAEVRVDDRRLLAIKSIPVALTTAMAARRNPTLGALLLDGIPQPTFTAGRVYELAATVRVDSLDEVCTELELSLEDVRVHLYTTSGELGASSLDLEQTGDGTSSEEVTTWTAPDSGDSTLWLVAIDSDGGADWKSFALSPSR